MKRRSTPLGWFIVVCLIGIVAIAIVVMQIRVLDDKLETNLQYYSTRDGYLGMKQAEHYATTYSLSVTVDYLARQQQSVVTATGVK